MRPGPSNIYMRLLRGQVTPEWYVAVLKRAIDMRIKADRNERRVARALEARTAMKEHRRGKPISFSWPRWPRGN